MRTKKGRKREIERENPARPYQPLREKDQEKNVERGAALRTDHRERSWKSPAPHRKTNALMRKKEHKRIGRSTTLGRGASKRRPLAWRGLARPDYKWRGGGPGEIGDDKRQC